jgi:hypothetical protein
VQVVADLLADRGAGLKLAQVDASQDIGEHRVERVARRGRGRAPLPQVVDDRVDLLAAVCEKRVRVDRVGREVLRPDEIGVDQDGERSLGLLRAMI